MRLRILCVVTCLLSMLSANAQEPLADSLLNFIVQNKSRSALYLVRNEEVLAKLNEKQMMPLAQTVYILIAIEFAKQAAAEMIFDQEYVPLSDLDKYYIPETDDYAHENWMAYAMAKRLIKEDSVKLIDVARGMMMFNSNANAEYLVDLMGSENIQSNIRILDIEKHSIIAPMVSSMFLFQNPKKKKQESILKEIRKMDDELYCKYTYQIHKELENSPGFKSGFRLKDFIAMQKLWSDRLTASSAEQYGKIVGILNRRIGFDPTAYGFIAEILETYMENPEHVTQFKHVGMKGGSTPWVITKALYFTTLNKSKVELVYFFDDLTPEEQEKLKKWTKAFDEEILKNKAFQNKVANTID